MPVLPAKSPHFTDGHPLILPPGQHRQHQFFIKRNLGNLLWLECLDGTGWLKRVSLLLETCPRWRANAFVNRLVVHANDGLRAVAPEMAGRDVFAVLVGKGFLGRRAGEHFFGAEMFAKCVHASPFSLSSVRRMSAWASGTLKALCSSGFASCKIISAA